jgi:DNA-directed RNA polymerase subunit M/transcription elongation factor TFIIS
MVVEEQLKSCEGCGATIYPEHITNGRATIVNGKLLCPLCVNEKKAKTQVAPAVNEEPESLTLVDEREFEQSGRKIEAFSEKANKTHVAHEAVYKRPLQKTGAGATRVKVFHTKLNDGAVEFMAHIINEWVDSNPDVEIKDSQTTVGIWEGKHPEPHLILTVWY